MSADNTRYVPDPDNPSDPVAIHKIASDQFARALKAMNDLTEALDRGDLEASKDTQDWSKILTKAAVALRDETARLDALFKDTADDLSEIDLDSVRADLQRQLARIADTLETD
ncbi:MAG: hypothetical protein VX874_17070 [Pseudomonadota bacterium]|nr:hypothetical protein [Pseudomonadota bacterium]